MKSPSPAQTPKRKPLYQEWKNCWLLLPAISTKCGMIFSQYGEHRLVPSKLLYIGYYYLTGGVNFRVIGLIGESQLLVMAFVSIYFIRKHFSTGWQLVAFVWMLCILFEELLFWGCGVRQNKV